MTYQNSYRGIDRQCLIALQILPKQPAVKLVSMPARQQQIILDSKIVSKFLCKFLIFNFFEKNTSFRKKHNKS